MNPDKLAGLSETAARLEFENRALTEALNQVERDIEQAEELARREADKEQREATAQELHKLIDGLEKAVAPVPVALLALAGASRSDFARHSTRDPARAARPDGHRGNIKNADNFHFRTRKAVLARRT